MVVLGDYTIGTARHGIASAVPESSTTAALLPTDDDFFLPAKVSRAQHKTFIVVGFRSGPAGASECIESASRQINSSLTSMTWADCWLRSDYSQTATSALTTYMFATTLDNARGASSLLRSSEQSIASFLSFIRGLDESGQPRAAAKQLMARVEMNLAARNLQWLNELLLEFDPARFSEWSSVAMLRSTFRASHRLPGWRQAYEKSRKVFDDRALPTDKLLAGLVRE